MSKKEFIERFMKDTSKSYPDLDKKLKKGIVEFSREQKDAIIKSYKNGKSLRSLGKDYGCSRDTITRRLISLGVK